MYKYRAIKPAALAAVLAALVSGFPVWANPGDEAMGRASASASASAPARPSGVPDGEVLSSRELHGNGWSFRGQHCEAYDAQTLAGIEAAYALATAAQAEEREGRVPRGQYGAVHKGDWFLVLAPGDHPGHNPKLHPAKGDGYVFKGVRYRDGGFHRPYQVRPLDYPDRDGSLASSMLGWTGPNERMKYQKAQQDNDAWNDAARSAAKYKPWMLWKERVGTSRTMSSWSVRGLGWTLEGVFNESEDAGEHDAKDPRVKEAIARLYDAARELQTQQRVARAR